MEGSYTIVGIPLVCVVKTPENLYSLGFFALFIDKRGDIA